MTKRQLTKEIVKCHQTNCVTTYAKGLADVLFRKFPYADTYSRRTATSGGGRGRGRGRGRGGDPSLLGTIEVYGGPDTGKQGVINMFGQINPGKPG